MESMGMVGFFRAIFGTLEPGNYINIRAFHARSGRKGVNEFARSAEEAVEIVGRIPNDLEIYFGVNPRRGKDGSKSGVAWVHLYHADVDWKWYEGSREAALEAVLGFELEPSLVVESGSGFHCYWFLTEPLPRAQIAVAEGHMRRLYFALGGLDAVQDVSRILRVPGTYNNKDPRQRKQVRVVYENTETRHSPEDFEQFLPEMPVKLEYKEQTEYLGDEERPTLEFLRELLAHIDPCVPYSVYYTIWAAVAYYYPDEDGLALVDEWSTERREAAGQYSTPRTQPGKHAGFRRQLGRVTTIGTLIHYAKQGGWVPPLKPLPMVIKSKRDGSLSTTIKKRREDMYRRKLDDLPNPTYDELPLFLQKWYDFLGVIADPFPRDYTTMMGLTFCSMFFPAIRFENLGVNLWINASIEQGAGKNAVTDAMFNVVKRMTAITPYLYTSGTAEGMYRKLKGDGKTLMCYLGEFGDFLAGLTREHMKGARGVFCNLYDGRDIAHQLSKEETVITNPFCVMVGTTTPQVLVSTMTQEDLYGGFASRFWYIACEYQNVGRNDDPTPEACEELAKEFDRQVLDLLNVRRAVWDCPRGEVPVAYRDYERLCGVGTGEVRTFIDALENPKTPKGRFLARVKKVATLLELLDLCPQVDLSGNLVIRNRYVELAITLVRRSEVYQEIILNTIGNTQEEKAMNQIDRVLARAGSIGLTRSQIMQQAHVKSGDLKALLPIMLEEGLVESYTDKDGKPMWRSTEPLDTPAAAKGKEVKIGA